MFRLLTALAFFVSGPAICFALQIEGAVTPNDKPPSEKIIVALAASLTQAEDESASPYGLQLKKGIELALSDSKQKLNEANIDIEMQEYDTQGSIVGAADMALEVIKSKAVAVIGHLFSSEALVAGRIYGEKGPLLFVSPGATAEELQAVGKHIVSTVFNNLEQAKMLVKAATDKKLTTAAIVSVTDCAYCENLSVLFQVEARRAPLEVKSVQNILSGGDELEGLKLEALKDVDVIFLPNYETANAKVIEFLDANGISPQYYLGGDGWGLSSEVFRNLVGNIPFKAMTLSYWSPGLKDKIATEFSARFEAKHNTLPTDSAVLAYDGMMRLIDILIRAEKPITRKALLDIKTDVKKSAGALGPIENHEWVISRPYVILEYDGLEVIDTVLNRTEL